jgi:hypothetical protein
MSPAVAVPERGRASRDERIETIKRWIGYIPEVRLAKFIHRWIKTQPSPELGSGSAADERTQAR